MDDSILRSWSNCHGVEEYRVRVERLQQARQRAGIEGLFRTDRLSGVHLYDREGVNEGLELLIQIVGSLRRKSGAQENGDKRNIEFLYSIARQNCT